MRGVYPGVSRLTSEHGCVPLQSFKHTTSHHITTPDLSEYTKPGCKFVAEKCVHSPVYTFWNRRGVIFTCPLCTHQLQQGGTQTAQREKEREGEKEEWLSLS